MACRLFGAEPLPEPMLAYCQLDSWEQIPVISNRNSIIFIRKNAFEIIVCQYGGHSVQEDELNEFHWREWAVTKAFNSHQCSR